MTAFYLLNLIILPLVVLCCMTINAEGLRETMDVFETRLFRLPIPGLSYLRDFDGWNRLDLAFPMALVLFVTISVLWKKSFQLLQDPGNLSKQRSENPILFYLMTGIIVVIILGDAGIFYSGLSSTVESSWKENTGYVPAVATVIFSSSLALLGAWHASHYHSRKV